MANRPILNEIHSQPAGVNFVFMPQKTSSYLVSTTQQQYGKYSFLLLPFLPPDVLFVYVSPFAAAAVAAVAAAVAAAAAAAT